jgi:hypothetical protein
MQRIAAALFWYKAYAEHKQRKSLPELSVQVWPILSMYCIGAAIVDLTQYAEQWLCSRRIGSHQRQTTT